MIQLECEGHQLPYCMRKDSLEKGSVVAMHASGGREGEGRKGVQGHQLTLLHEERREPGKRQCGI